MNCHIQRRSRVEGVATRLLENTFKIMDFLIPTVENCPVEQFTTYMHGMWLQGAEWDYETKLLVEPVSAHLFQEFPVVKTVCEKKDNVCNSGYLDNIALLKTTNEEFNDNP